MVVYIFLFFTFFSSHVFSMEISNDALISDIPNGSIMRIEYGSSWFGRTRSNFLNKNDENQVCKVYMSQAGNSSLEEVSGVEALTIQITSYVWSRTFNENYRQIVRLIFAQGWVDCLINKPEALTVGDIAAAFPDLKVSIDGPPDVNTLNKSKRTNKLTDLEKAELIVDTRDLKTERAENCFFTSDKESERIENLKLSSYFYNSQKNTITLALEAKEVYPPDGYNPLILHCQDTDLDELHKSLTALQ